MDAAELFLPPLEGDESHRRKEDYSLYLKPDSL